MAEQQPSAATTSTGMQTTVVNKKWALKMILIAAAFLALLIWGIVDAIIVYPKRGARAAEFGEFQHLSELQNASKISNDQATVKDPATELSKLLAQVNEQVPKLSGRNEVHG